MSNTQSNQVIQLEELRFSWKKGQSPILDIPHFSVSEGERVFIQGASGSGKTTLLSLLGGILLPQSGKIETLGEDLAKLSGKKRDAFRVNHIGFIFQMFNLLPYLNLIENVTLPCHFSETRYKKAKSGPAGSLQEEAVRLLAELGLSGKKLLESKVSELSIGQQQRVAAARALIGSPEILIADEPTSSLDADSRESFLQLLFEECSQSNTTLVFVSHDRFLSPMFDRTVNLSEINKTANKNQRSA